MPIADEIKHRHWQVGAMIYIWESQYFQHNLSNRRSLSHDVGNIESWGINYDAIYLLHNCSASCVVTYSHVQGVHCDAWCPMDWYRADFSDKHKNDDTWQPGMIPIPPRSVMIFTHWLYFHHCTYYINYGYLHLLLSTLSQSLFWWETDTQTTSQDKSEIDYVLQLLQTKL